MLEANGSLSAAHLAILADADRHFVTQHAAAEGPRLPKARAFVPLSDAEWSAVAAHWPAASHALYEPRLLLDAALEVAAFGTPWPYVYGAYGARQFFIRRSRTGMVQRLADAANASLNIGPERQPQFHTLRTAAEAFAVRRGLTPLSKQMQRAVSVPRS